MIAAGFWRRYTAWSLDAAIVGMAAGVITARRLQASSIVIADSLDAVVARIASLAIEGLRSAEPPTLLARAWLHDELLFGAMDRLHSALVAGLLPGLTAVVALAALYWVAFEASPWQATPGKRALDLVVTDVRGQRPGVLRAAGRHVAGLLSWLTLNAGHALAALPPHRRALHDYLAGTRVMQRVAGGLPLWARLWLCVQALAMLGTSVWLMQRLQDALQRALDTLL